MSDDSTKKLPDNEQQIKEAVLDPRITELINLVQALDAKLDARLHDTRPIWTAVQTQLEVVDTQIGTLRAEIAEQFSKLNKKLDILNRELLEVKTEQERHGDRLDALERKPS